MNYYFTASPPQADLNALGIVTKKQAFAHHVITPADIDLPPIPDKPEKPALVRLLSVLALVTVMLQRDMV